jgi:hypothetical protein
MEFAKRELKATLVSRFDYGSTELTALEAQTQGTAVLGLTGGTGFDTTINMTQVRFKTATIANEQGIVTVSTDISALYDGVSLANFLSMTVNNTLGSMGRLTS